MNKKIVVIGQGAREHALAYRLEKSQDGSKDASRQIMVVPGNAGILRDFECLVPSDTSLSGIIDTIKKINPHMVIIGPEYWLSEGLSDALIKEGIAVFGPTKKAAEIESSKIFMKEICRQAKVKTAASENFADKDAAKEWLKEQQDRRFVIKIDGLCAGKGVVIAQNKQEALAHVDFLFSDDGFSKMGIKNCSFLIEEFLDGQEVSVFAMCNAKDGVLFAPMQDHKRLKDYNEGPNTGGMGAVAFLGENTEDRKKFLMRVKKEVVLPVLREMAERGCPFKGLLYAGLMLVNDEIYVLEFNARFGDPETQALMMALKTDICPLFENIARDEQIDLDSWQDRLLNTDNAVAIVLASENYPVSASEPARMSIPMDLPLSTRLFFAGVSSKEDTLYAESGRVVTISSAAPTLNQAKKDAYVAAERVKFSGSQYRRDIGDILSRLI